MTTSSASRLRSDRLRSGDMDLNSRLPERSGVTELQGQAITQDNSPGRRSRPGSGTCARGLWFRGADAGGAAVRLDRADLLQVLAAVEGEGEDLLLDHALDEDRLAVLRPGGALAPMPDRRFRDLRQVVAGEAEDLHQAEIVEEGRFLRLVRAVHHRDGDVLAVRRHLQPLGRLPDRDGVDDPRRLRLEVDDADRVGVALADADIGDDRDVAVAGRVDLVGAQPGVDVALAILDLVAGNRQHRDLVVVVPRHERHSAVAREHRHARAGVRLAELDLLLFLDL